MTQAVSRTHFHRSTLMRYLVDLGAEEAGESGTAFAQQLSQWVNFADAISLSAVLNEAGAGPAKISLAGLAGPAAALEAAVEAVLEAANAAFERVRSLLTQSITQSIAVSGSSCAGGTPSTIVGNSASTNATTNASRNASRNASTNAFRSRIRPPEPVLALPIDLAATWASYRRCYEAHQRDMELHLQPLRVTLRQALAKASPALAKLAELDAALEKILRERETKLLAKVPLLLKKRFEQGWTEHQQLLRAAQQEDNPTAWLRPGGWLERFHQEMRTLLLAELELRLQPAQGLLEALNNESS